MSFFKQAKIQSSDQTHSTIKALQKTGSVVSGLLALSFCLLASSQAQAIDISFTKVVDTNTLVPNGTKTSTFTYFFGNAPSLDNGSVAFLANGILSTLPFQEVGPQGVLGIYTNLGGSLNVLADTRTQIPGGTRNFFSLNSPSFKNGSVAFAGSLTQGSPTQSIYTNIGGSLNLVADLNTPVPGSTENFGYLTAPSLDNGSVAFLRSGLGLPIEGVYTNLGGSLSAIADMNTPIPGGTGNFTRFSNPSLSNGIVTFIGFGDSEEVSQAGIYTNLGGLLNAIADTNTAIPGGTGNFTNFTSLSSENGSVAFIGQRRETISQPPSQQGIYTNLGGSLRAIADLNTPIPNGTGNFTSFRSLSLNKGNIAFLGANSSSQGIYTNLSGLLTKVIATGDSLDGKTVSSSVPQFDQGLLLGQQSLSGNQIAFSVGFTDGSEAIYIATVNSGNEE
ncbi:MAG: hypothetical protein PUP93_12285 [Rhizonema sp. NSF051]|nr:hypothetical protein [Rhizonema sp. NSF051]